eukprot:939798-Pelagomonas_calceolata.AAC.3
MESGKAEMLRPRSMIGHQPCIRKWKMGNAPAKKHDRLPSSYRLESGRQWAPKREGVNEKFLEAKKHGWFFNWLKVWGWQGMGTKKEDCT